MADKTFQSSNATAENATTRPEQVNANASFDPQYTEIAKLLSIAAGIVIINSVVFYLYITKKSLRTTSNYPLFSLAACDFLCGFLIIPLFTISFFTPLVASLRSKFYLGFLVTVLHNFIAIATVYHIVVVTAERYIAIKFPLKHRLLHPKRMQKVLAIVWLCSLLVSSIPFSWISKVYPVFQLESLKFTLGFTIFCMAFALVLPYMFLIYAFVRMFKAINRSLPNFSRSSPNDYGQQNPVMARKHRLLMKSTGERKCLMLFVIMALVFLVCWLPWFVLFLLHQLPLDPSKLQVPSQVALLVRYLTSVINPLLYTFLKRDFLRALKFVFRRRDSRQNSTSFNACSTRRGTLQTDPCNKPVDWSPKRIDPTQLTSLHAQCFDDVL